MDLHCDQSTRAGYPIGPIQSASSGTSYGQFELRNVLGANGNGIGDFTRIPSCGEALMTLLLSEKFRYG